jgi:phosphoglycolate phosphatase-like HAD superfamily hydrolase
MRTILFDVDGTLLFLRGVGKQAMERAMADVWEVPGALDGVSFAGATDSLVAHTVAPGRATGDMWARYYDHLDAALAEFPDKQPLQGVTELLDALEARGAHVALLTGNLQRAAQLKLESVGLLERFDWDRSAFAEDGVERVDVAHAARRRNNGAALAIIGDSVADVTCARAIGARVLAVGTGPQDDGMLHDAGPDHFVADLTDTRSIVSWLLEQP